LDFRASGRGATFFPFPAVFPLVTLDGAALEGAALAGAALAGALDEEAEDLEEDLEEEEEEAAGFLAPSAFFPPSGFLSDGLGG